MGWFSRISAVVAVAVAITSVSGCSGLSGLARTMQSSSYGYGYGYNPYAMQQYRTANAFAETRAAIEASRRRPVTSGGYAGGSCGMPGAYVTCD